MCLRATIETFSVTFGASTGWRSTRGCVINQQLVSPLGVPADLRFSLTPSGLANQYYGLIPQHLLPYLGVWSLLAKVQLNRINQEGISMLQPLKQRGLQTALLPSAALTYVRTKSVKLQSLTWAVRIISSITRSPELVIILWLFSSTRCQDAAGMLHLDYLNRWCKILFLLHNSFVV